MRCLAQSLLTFQFLPHFMNLLIYRSAMGLDVRATFAVTRQGMVTYYCYLSIQNVTSIPNYCTGKSIDYIQANRIRTMAIDGLKNVSTVVIHVVLCCIGGAARTWCL